MRITKIMEAIKTVVHAAGPNIGFMLQDVSARYLQAGWGMEFLTACVDPDTIWFISKWWSDTMFRYLHTTSESFTDSFDVRMFRYINYALILPAHTAG